MGGRLCFFRKWDKTPLTVHLQRAADLKRRRQVVSSYPRPSAHGLEVGTDVPNRVCMFLRLANSAVGC